VADHGAGIPEAVQARIFEPFFSTKSRHEGTGLGLSISHGIVKDHHGKLWFETVPGEGAKFHVELPVEPEENV
jgi:signal transduction histidine kinase